MWFCPVYTDLLNMGDCKQCIYCLEPEETWESVLSFRCETCDRFVHYDCIKSHQPSSLLKDTFFVFKCEACGEDNKEEFERAHLSWLNAVLLSMYNLHKTCQGLCGFYHWKSHVSAFLDQHWTSLFGFKRKKTSLWLGTVAGTLSGGCPRFFVSGASVVEQGYWKLAVVEPPLPQQDNKLDRKRTKPQDSPLLLDTGQRRCRKLREETSLQAAIELKEKRARTQEAKELKRIKQKQKEESESAGKGNGLVEEKEKSLPKKNDNSSDQQVQPFVANEEKDSNVELTQPACLSGSEASLGSDSLQPIASTSASFCNNSDTGGDFLTLKGVIDDDSDLEIDVDVTHFNESVMGFPDFRPSSPDMSTIFESYPGINPPPTKSPRDNQAQVEIKQEPVSDDSGSDDLEISPEDQESEDDIPDTASQNEVEEEEEEENGEVNNDDDEADEEEDDDEEEEDDEVEEEDDSQSTVAEADQREEKEGFVKRKRGRPRKRRRDDDTPPPSPPQSLQKVSLFEEGELLQRLNTLADQGPLRPDVAQLRRKLICNKTNREFGLPVFDLGKIMNKMAQKGMASSNINPIGLGPTIPLLPKTTNNKDKETRDLDRFMMPSRQKEIAGREYTTFRQRLVGLKDHELKPVISPYTTRVLLPFIWRNYDPSRKPLRMRLLEQIKAYPHRNNPSWTPEPSPPIDYCYVRPEHIPSVNALCREFFWPGIDMSECLLYPDFSCVVLFRKIVIGFAFMVPDRGYNEAYISFIFTHPEWRGAGIATFMLYHLIQTCMGKDVLLHVSVSNPAVLLYQKFGFKAEEFNVNFYYRYFPLESQDSSHAYLMRLSR